MAGVAGLMVALEEQYRKRDERYGQDWLLYEQGAEDGAARGACAPFPPMIGPLVGVVFLFATAALFSGFFPFLFFVWVIPFLLVPMLGLTARGVAGFLAERPRQVSKGDKEKELLEAIERHGEITPARAALETSLSVSEADRMLSELAKNGYIEVRVREERLGYALWEHDRSLPEG